MSKLLWVVGFVCLLASSALAQGLQKGQVEISLGGGAGIPVGDFGDAATAGFQLGGDIGYYTSPQMVIGLEGNYFGFGASDELKAFWEFLTGDPNPDLSWSEFQITGYGKYLFSPQNFSPYFKAGAGFYDLKLTVTYMGADVSDSQSDFGLMAGAGLQFKGEGNVGGFVEAMVHDVLTEGSSTTFFGIRGGATFFLGQK